MPGSREEKFSAGRTKCRSPKNMVEQSSTVLVINKEYLNHTLGLNLSIPGLVCNIFTSQNFDHNVK